MGRKNPLAAVYCIRNLENGKIYFGESSNFVDRMSAYRTAARNRLGKTTLSPIYKAIQEYGYDSFTFEIVVSELDDPRIKDDIYRRQTEARYIRRYNTTDPNIGYNQQGTFIRKNYGTKIGTPHTTETKFKKSDAVISYKIDTEECMMYGGCADCASLLGFSDRAIIARCCKNGKSSHGYYFFKVDFAKRDKAVRNIIREKSASHDKLGRGVSSLRTESLKKYIAAVRAMNKFCENLKMPTVDIDDILNE